MKAFVGLICLVLLARVDAVEKLKLSSGHEMPAIGLGTGHVSADQIDQVVTSALENGYRHFDMSLVYKNEAAIGRTIKKWFDKGNKREDLFITSKLPNQANRPESVEKYLNHTLMDLDLDYVDMYLMHLPFGAKEGKDFRPQQKDGYDELEDDVDHVAIWKEMEKQVKSGRAKSIGVSNFNETQLLDLYNNAEIKPSNLQVEWHLYLQQQNLLKFCKDKNIVLTAYGALGSQGMRNHLHKGTSKDLPPADELPIVKELAKKYNKSPAQILLRHIIQSGLGALPRSRNSGRQKENISVFDFKLTDEEMRQLNALDKGEVGRVYDLLTLAKDITKNKYYPFCKTYKQL